MSRIIIEDLDEGTAEMQNALKNYLKSHDWDYKEENKEEDGKCEFCGEVDKVKLISLECEDEVDEDLERDLLLVCDHCHQAFSNVCDVLKLKEEDE